VTVSEIRSRLRRLKSTHGLAICYIDYLQLVRPSSIGGRNVNRNEELSEICRTLKATAKDLEIPIVALAQLNRAVETRQDKRPMLSDLRDCLAGSTLVANADTGARIAMSRIVDEDMRFNVWAMDERMRLVRRPITEAWAVAEKPMFDVRTRAAAAFAAPMDTVSGPCLVGPSCAIYRLEKRLPRRASSGTPKMGCHDDAWPGTSPWLADRRWTPRRQRYLDRCDSS